MGGSLAVSDAIISELESLSLSATRVSGSNRYATAAEIFKIGKELGGEVKNALIANGSNPADALAAGAYAHYAGIPVLLVKTDSIPEETKAALAGNEKTYVIGGELAVSEAVMLPARRLLKNPGTARRTSLW